VNFLFDVHGTIHKKAWKKIVQSDEGIFFIFNLPGAKQALQKQTWLWSHDLFPIQVCKTLRVSQKKTFFFLLLCKNITVTLEIYEKQRHFDQLEKALCLFLGTQPPTFEKKSFLLARTKSQLFGKKNLLSWRGLFFPKNFVKWIDILDKLREAILDNSTNKLHCNLQSYFSFFNTFCVEMIKHKFGQESLSLDVTMIWLN